MYKKQDLLNLKSQYSQTLEEINEFGEEQFKDILELTEWLEELIEKTERLKKQEEASNQDLRQKFKLGRKLQRAYKTDLSFEATVIQAIEDNKIPEYIGDKFKEIAKLLKKRKIEAVKNEFEYFENLVKLNKKYQKIKEEIGIIKSDLNTKINKTENILKNLQELQTSDKNKYILIEKYLENLEKLENIRKEYISSLLNLKLIDLFSKIKQDKLFEFNFPPISYDKLEDLIVLFQKDKFFQNMKITDLIKYFDYSDQKLSHVYPELSKFKKLILKERVWFDQISHLDQTNFLKWKKEEKLSDELKQFYKQIPSAKQVLKEIEEYEKELPKFKQQYREYQEYKLKLKELEEYSKKDLEEELKKYNDLLETLTKKQEIPIQKDKGLFEKLKGFFE